ncbi:MAG: hypothetical protein C5B55_08165 [Blastocatellia bacterium]|nr:MAG: hypothetical protein C5B55_08165 [Blastocatellia bacterium]
MTSAIHEHVLKWCGQRGTIKSWRRFHKAEEGTMINLWRDIRYGMRVLIRRPGFTLIVIATLALGIGADTAIFSVIYGVLLRPLPYRNGHELVVLHQQAPLANINDLQFSVKEIEDYRQQNQTLSEVVEHHSMSFILYGGDEPEDIQTGVVSANFFEVLGVKPLLGRTFLPGDEGRGAEGVMVLSYKYWQRSHGGDPNIINKIFTMNDRPHKVIGVLPPIPQYPNEEDVYMPTSSCPLRSSDAFIANRNRRLMDVFCRVKPGIQREQVQADLTTIASRLEQTYPDSYPATRGYRTTLSSLQQELTRRAQPTFLVLLAAATLVLLIACFNVANLMLARLMQREREFALRSAMGASRWRLVQQLLTESSLLAVAGGVAGILLAANGLNLLAGFAARFTTRAAEIKIDSAVLIFTLAVSLFTGLIFGLLPALSMKASLSTTMKEGGTSSSGIMRNRLRRLLVVAQVAVSFTLLIGAGLMLRSFIKLQQVDPGFNPERVMVVRMNPNWIKYKVDQYRDFYRRLVEKMKNQPGVEDVAIASSYPLRSTDGPSYSDLSIEGRPQDKSEPTLRADLRYASPDFFTTIRMPLLKGRVFSDADRQGALPVALINQAMARHYWSNADPIGKRISLPQLDGQWREIVGVVGDVRQYGLEQDQTDAAYVTLDQGGFRRWSYLLVRTTAEPTTMIKQMRAAVHEIDPETVVDRETTLEQAQREALTSPRLTMLLITLFALTALVITAAGIAGVMALSVSQRKQELGIRLALGATPRSVLWMVLRQGMVAALLGLAIGSVAALALTRMLRTLLFAIEPTDPFTFIAVSCVLATTAFIACIVPARRVTSIDPMTALRCE